LTANRFAFLHSEKGDKREPGANPGQSRCCETPNNVLKRSEWPLAANDNVGKASGRESVRRPAGSGDVLPSRGLDVKTWKV